MPQRIRVSNNDRQTENSQCRAEQCRAGLRTQAVQGRQGQKNIQKARHKNQWRPVTLQQISTYLHYSYGEKQCHASPTLTPTSIKPPPTKNSCATLQHGTRVAPTTPTPIASRKGHQLLVTTCHFVCSLTARKRRQCVLCYGSLLLLCHSTRQRRLLLHKIASGESEAAAKWRNKEQTTTQKNDRTIPH